MVANIKNENSSHYEERASYSWSEDSIRLINTPSATAKSIYFYLQEVGYFKTVFPYFTERKNLNSFLLVYTLSGQGKLKYEGQEYFLKPGQCFFIHCMKDHYYETPKGEAWEFLWIHFNSSTALGYYQEFVKNGFQLIDLHDTGAAESLLRQIITVNQKKDFASEINTSQLIVSLLTQVLVHSNLSSSQLITVPEPVREVMAYIDKHFQDHLTLDGLARQFAVSKFHLAKEFSRYIGVSLNEYVILARLAYAKELLRYSTLPVSEIASACGIPHVSHFINLFKARENTTPLTYRKEWC